MTNHNTGKNKYICWTFEKLGKLNTAGEIIRGDVGRSYAIWRGGTGVALCDDLLLLCTKLLQISIYVRCVYKIYEIIWVIKWTQS